MRGLVAKYQEILVPREFTGQLVGRIGELFDAWMRGIHQPFLLRIISSVIRTSTLETLQIFLDAKTSQLLTVVFS